jgi:hypothetical protein
MATPVRLPTAPVCPDTKPRNTQARKATETQQTKTQNKADTCRKEGEGATGPSRQLCELCET